MSGIFCFAFLTVFALYVVQSGSALNCYDCTQPKGFNLSCEMSPTDQTECDETATQCITYSWGGLNRPSILTRGCATAGYCETWGAVVNPGNQLQSCEYCDGDLCNSA